MKTTGGNPIKSGLRETQTSGNEMWVNHYGSTLTSEMLVEGKGNRE